MTFDQELEVILKHEGGYVDDPLDPGGETNYGISKKQYPDLDIKNITPMEVREIYKKDYYDENRCGEIVHQKVRLHFFDIMVNTGNAKILQRAVNRISKNKLEIDGIVGGMTLAVVNTIEDEIQLNNWLYVERMAHYDTIRKSNKNLKKFMWIWVNRSLSFVY